jgi:uncharacterized protein (DUF488 family)
VKHFSHKSSRTIWTIGHSTRTGQEFLNLLTSYRVEILVDVRRYPGSRKYPQYNIPALVESLANANINYQHIEALGGRRKPKSDSHHTVWRNDAFRGYADYSDTDEFKEGMQQLTAIAAQHRTAYMCSEAVWWRCHRCIISDVLKAEGWTVMHIMGDGIAKEHPFTAAYRSTHNL